MITDKGLLEDKSKLEGEILNLESAIALKQQELQQSQTQLIKFVGALGYIMDNLKQKESEKCPSEET